MKILIDYSEKRICKIDCSDGGHGTGFFCVIPLDDWDNNMRALITNSHVLEKNDILIGKKIKFSLNNERENNR